MGSLEYDQGLDVLMIMRNIHVFVARFSYSLNQQNFVERRPDRGSKNLNTINVQSIAASLRQHGLGILNTTVNFTYHFLAQKFHVFSQFLFDEYIRGHLGKERRWFRKQKSALGNKYPHERAERFVGGIRKLGLLEQGRLTFLDQFRLLVTEIGNALGYVRLVRSAGMLFCSDAVHFLPGTLNLDAGHRMSFEQHTGAGKQKPAADGVEEQEVIGAGLSEETVRAARNVDQVISTLTSNLAEGSNYLKALVSVFQQVLMNGDHSHLESFYMIIPALCLSWVGASQQAKSNMYKSKEGYYSDDGFAMGIAYIMAILKQSDKFDGLHWFESMRLKLDADAQKIAEMKAERVSRQQQQKQRQKQSRSIFSRSVVETGSEDDEEEIYAIQQSESKLVATRREHDLLFFSLSGARIFFK